ncbi:protein SDA1 homolog [Hemitrygon akajei]|uniref:protein SDA1 homolog n=1 Tax=Hemitrygon akajei TaxID=2704970 RepID=UPI003BF99318
MNDSNSRNDGWESTSIDEDEDDEVWVDVHHSSDEEQQEELIRRGKLRTAVMTKAIFRGELLSLRDIERLHKKPKSDKETRLATAMFAL